MITNITWPLSLLADYHANQWHTLRPEHNQRSPTCLRSISECQVGWRKPFSITRSIQCLLFCSWWNLLIFWRESKKIVQLECASIDKYRSLLLPSKSQIFLFQIQSRVLQKKEHCLLRQNCATIPPNESEMHPDDSTWCSHCAPGTKGEAGKLQDCI